MSGVPKWPGDRIGTGEACLVYQSGQEIGLVQEGLVWCTKEARRYDWYRRGLSGVPKRPGDRIGTGGACLVYQSGQEI